MQFLKKQRYIDDELGGLKNIFFATHTHSYIQNLNRMYIQQTEQQFLVLKPSYKLSPLSEP